MLDFIRDKASSFVVKFILGLIIVVFVFFGWGAYKSGQMNQVARVNDQVITPQEYKAAYNELINNLRARFQGNLSNSMIEMFQLDKQALNSVIQQALIDQKAQELKIKISDEELAKYISGLDYFLTEGSFDSEKYNRLLSANGMTPEGFEDRVRKSLLRERITELITEAVKVTDKELLEWYNYNNKKADIKYAEFSSVDYDSKDFKVSEDEIKKYYEENKENYKSEEMVKVAFLQFSPEDFKKDVNIAKSEIESYYNENIESYRTPEKVKARHILIKVSSGGDEKEVKDAEKRILDIKKKIDSGKDFAEMAKKYSQGPSSVAGGDLGEFTKEAMVAPFAEAAFKLKAGSVSEPVRTDFGWHLIKVEKNLPESVKTLDEVKSEINEKLALRKAKLLAYDKADGIYGATLKGSSLKEEAEAMGLTPAVTDFFTRKGPSGVADPQKFAKEAFSFDKGEASEVIEVGETLYILEVVEKKAPDFIALALVKEDIKKSIVLVKKDEKAENDAKAYLKKVTGEKKLEVSDIDSKIEIKEAKGIKRQGYTESLGSAAELQTSVFAVASKGGKFSDEVVKSGSKYYVFSVENVEIPSKEDFSREKDGIKKQMLSRKKGNFFNKWIEKEKEKAEIVISQQFN